MTRHWGATWRIGLITLCIALTSLTNRETPPYSADQRLSYFYDTEADCMNPGWGCGGEIEK